MDIWTAVQLKSLIDTTMLDTDESRMALYTKQFFIEEFIKVTTPYLRVARGTADTEDFQSEPEKLRINQQKISFW